MQAFDWDYLAGCHELAPDLVLAALGDKELTAEKLDEIAKTGARVVGWEDKYTNAGTIAAIHARGWKAWVWTVDEPERVGATGAGQDRRHHHQPARRDARRSSQPCAATLLSGVAGRISAVARSCRASRSSGTLCGEFRRRVERP